MFLFFEHEITCSTNFSFLFLNISSLYISQCDGSVINLSVNFCTVKFRGPPDLSELYFCCLNQMVLLQSVWVHSPESPKGSMAILIEFLVNLAGEHCAVLFYSYLYSVQEHLRQIKTHQLITCPMFVLSVKFNAFICKKKFFVLVLLLVEIYQSSLQELELVI